MLYYLSLSTLPLWAYSAVRGEISWQRLTDASTIEKSCYCSPLSRAFGIQLAVLACEETSCCGNNMDVHYADQIDDITAPSSCFPSSIGTLKHLKVDINGGSCSSYCCSRFVRKSGCGLPSGKTRRRSKMFAVDRMLTDVGHNLGLW